MKRRGLLLVMLMLLCCTLIQSDTNEDVSAYKQIPVGVIIDMGSWVGNTVLSYITMAVTDFYTINSHYKTRIVVHSRDTHGVPLHALSAALELMEEPKVQAIIGSESKFLAVLGDEARVPILSFSPSPSHNYHKHPYFLQITQDETIQFNAISAMAESFGCKNVIIICENTNDGREMATFMTKVFQGKNIFITYSSLISVSATSEIVHEEFHKLSMMETQIIIMHTSPSLSSHLLQNAKDLGMMDGEYKWIITGKTMNFLSLLDDGVFESMQGAIGFKSYIPQSRELHEFNMKWEKDINVYGIWAYDAVYALAMAIERTHVLKMNRSDFGTTTGSGQWGATLLNQMLRISFNGLGGAIRYNSGRISADVVEIVDVMGNEVHTIGFWAKNGTFTENVSETSSFSYEGLENIVWLKHKHTNPTRRVLQVTTKVLRIGIPLQFRAGSVFNVSYDPQNHSTIVSGFCLDVFLASIAGLNRKLSYKFIPFMPKAEAGTVNYNDLLHQVHNGEFDAAIGDITITANRSLYVDFTLPYTDLGLATLTKNVDASMWIFLEPLSSDLWIVSACFFILLGFVIWILEHQTNDEFQGSIAQQIGTTLWFAFSTMVYAHREKLQSNLSRFVVTVWLFVVFVLVSSYTATLSSLLTVEQIQLASKRGSIGYQYGSPVGGLIVRNMNFKDTRLKPYSTVDECAVALSRGSKNGGVDAIIDEVPYIKEFLVKYQSGYSMVASEDFTNGFGFAFPLGSPLASEISTQVAKLRENGSLKKLEDKWFKPRLNDSAPSQKILNFKGLRGLFLITGVSMATALFLYMVYYIREKVCFNYMMLAGGKLAFIMKLLVAKTANAASR